MNNTVFLPGLNKQVEFLLNRINLLNLDCLVIGSNSEEVAKIIQTQSQKDVEIIVEDYDTLMNCKLSLKAIDSVSVKMMEFEVTDYPNGKFDLVFVQGSITNKKRKIIIKEIKRILKPNGYFCVGEIVKLKNTIPTFVAELFERANLEPLNKDEFFNYYLERKFELVDSVDLSNSLKEYYNANIKLLNEKVKSLASNEKSYYKKVVNQIKHESNAYLNLGADRYMGFEVILLKKE